MVNAVHRTQRIDTTITDFLLLNIVCDMVFNANFNNISVISWLSVLLVKENGVLK